MCMGMVANKIVVVYDGNANLPPWDQVTPLEEENMSLSLMPCDVVTSNSPLKSPLFDNG